MFDFAWSEIMLIGAVALIAIGPKDMPAAIRTVTGMIKKARRMASEFQTHVDDMVREAELGDVKQAFNDLRRMDVSSAVEKMVDPDQSLRKTFEENPLDAPLDAQSSIPSAPDGADASGDGLPPANLPPEAHSDATDNAAESVAPAEPEGPVAPAFIPPNLVPKSLPTAASPLPPAFIPPEAALPSKHNA
jgi:sec-independent protein translocase protein TatB